MKTFIIAIILGALGYFIFIHDGERKQAKKAPDQRVTENQKLREELGVETKTYGQGAIEGFNNVKNTVNSAIDSASVR